MNNSSISETRGVGQVDTSEAREYRIQRALDEIHTCAMIIQHTGRTSPFVETVIDNVYQIRQEMSHE